MLVVGPTGSGKTYWLKELIKNADSMITPTPERIVYFYGEWQEAYETMRTSFPYGQFLFVKGLPSSETWGDFLSSTGGPTLFVIDDLMSEVNTFVGDLFTKGSHHRNLSVILILQNLFSKGKNNIGRTISLNSHYMLLFKNPRDKLSIDCLARQISPQDVGFIHDAYRMATKRPYGYLCLDFKPEQKDNIRYRGRVLPGETEYGAVDVYRPRTEYESDSD